MLADIGALFSILKGPANTVGVDMGSFALKALHLKGSFPDYSIGSWGYLPLELSSGWELPPHETKNICLAKLQTLVDRNKLLQKDVASGVDGPNLIVRTISIPRIAYQELTKTIQFEAEPFLPLSVDECELGFHILGQSKDDAKKMDVLLAAIKKDCLEAKIAVLNDAGLRPVIIDCNAFALFNAYQLVKNLGETVIILNIGSSITNMVLIENNVLKIVREMTYGGAEFTKSVQKSMAVDFNGAENLKSRYGIILSSEEKEKTLADGKNEALEVAVALGDPLKTLLADMQKLIEFYFGQNAEGVINRVLISGGSANIGNLTEYISKEVNVPAEILKPFSKILGSQVIPDGLKSSLVVALGLAMRKENDYLSKRPAKTVKGNKK